MNQKSKSALRNFIEENYYEITHMSPIEGDLAMRTHASCVFRTEKLPSDVKMTKRQKQEYHSLGSHFNHIHHASEAVMAAYHWIDRQ